MMLRNVKVCFYRIPSQNAVTNFKRTSTNFWERKKTAASIQQNPNQTEAAATNVKPHESSVEMGDRKPLRNTPFVKNLFLGKFDTKMLVFPEVLDNQGLKDLDEFIQPIEKFMQEKVDSRKLDQEGSMPSEITQQLKDFRLFGQLVPAEYGGLGHNETQFMRLGEVFGVDESVGLTLCATEVLGLEGLLFYGSDEQKAKYLPKLATGEHIGAFCLTEANSGSDASTAETKARLSDDKKSYIINGEKTWVTNGERADIFTVFAKTNVTSHTGQTEQRLTAFLVEKEFGGITCGKSYDKSGVRAANACSVRFEETHVPVENILGSIGEGYKVAMSVMNKSRHVIGSLCTGVMKKILEPAVEYTIKRKQFGKSLKDFGIIQDMISNVALNIYATESMTYATAALMDSYVHPDVAIESAIVKVFASEALFRSINDCIQIMGACGLMKEQELERHLRNSYAYLMFPATNEILRLYISLMCFQHTGANILDSVQKLRDPLNNVGYVLQKQFERLRTNRSNPTLTMKLYNHVHPDLSTNAEALEIRVIKFQYVVEKYMATFGDKLLEEQLALRRFADIAINLYGCTTCLARATRSKCIGLKNHDHEINLAYVFTSSALQRIDQLMDELLGGRFENGDDVRIKIAEKVVKNRGYAAEHPLTRNW